MRDSKGRFTKGNIPNGKGKTLEEFVGEKRAKEIKEKMSKRGKKKRFGLAKLNKDPVALKKRTKSRAIHEDKVIGLGKALRNLSNKVLVTSNWSHEAQPDLILIKDGKVIAIELESQKKWKPSFKTIKRRKEALHSKSQFFDKVKVVMFKENTSIEEILKEVV